MKRIVEAYIVSLDIITVTTFYCITSMKERSFVNQNEINTELLWIPKSEEILLRLEKQLVQLYQLLARPQNFRYFC